MRILLSRDFFTDKFFPLTLYWAFGSDKVGRHAHEFTELVIVVSGRGVYQDEFKTVEVVSQDVLFVPAGAPHQYYDEHKLELVNILFNFDKLPIPLLDVYTQPGFSALFILSDDYYRKKQFYPRFKIQDEDFVELCQILKRMYKEQENQKNGYRLFMLGGFMEVISLLVRNFSKSQNAQAKSITDISNTLDYLNNNFDQDILLSELSKMANMSVPTFIRHFKHATGQTPINYLIKLRISHAVTLLHNSGLSISEIAAETGFIDSNYFTRVFKNKTSMSPVEFRKKYSIAKNAT